MSLGFMYNVYFIFMGRVSSLTQETVLQTTCVARLRGLDVACVKSTQCNPLLALSAVAGKRSLPAPTVQVTDRLCSWGSVFRLKPESARQSAPLLHPQ